jgi:hypothetical protein
MSRTILDASLLVCGRGSALGQPSETRAPIRLRGVTLSDAEVDVIRGIAEEYWSHGRSYISRMVCKSLGWYQDNGRLKDRACRDVLRSLQQLGFLKLPLSKTGICHSHTPSNHALPDNHRFSPSNMANTAIENITCMSIVMVRWTKEDKLWNSLIATYHYLGHKLIVGRHLKYIVYDKDIPIACIGWGDAAWHISDRDAWIGWDQIQRRQNIKLTVNNVRFLILPWVKISNFASFILSRATKAMVEDWQRLYGVKPVLLETFVERDRFRGTCYRAANWIHVGSTKGFARQGYSYRNHQTPKDVYLYPLRANAREILRS